MIVFQPRPLILIYFALWVAFILGEVTLARRWRAQQGRVQADRGFGVRAAIVFIGSNQVAVLCWRFFPGASFATHVTACIGLVLMLTGLLLRWWAIIHLGRFFTVDVAVAADQGVIDSGPYRLVRHPSYSGATLFIAGVALCFGNLVSMLVLIAPFAVMLVKRMRIEEAALATGLGEAYRTYMNRTKRLIPGVY